MGYDEACKQVLRILREVVETGVLAEKRNRREKGFGLTTGYTPCTLISSAVLCAALLTQQGCLPRQYAEWRHCSQPARFIECGNNRTALGFPSDSPSSAACCSLAACLFELARSNRSIAPLRRALCPLQQQQQQANERSTNHTRARPLKQATSRSATTQASKQVRTRHGNSSKQTSKQSLFSLKKTD